MEQLDILEKILKTAGYISEEILERVREYASESEIFELALNIVEYLYEVVKVVNEFFGIISLILYLYRKLENLLKRSRKNREVSPPSLITAPLRIITTTTSKTQGVDNRKIDELRQELKEELREIRQLLYRVFETPQREEK